MKRYLIDGSAIRDFTSLCHAFAVAVDAPDQYFGCDIPSFDDCFFGYIPFEKPCEFVWTHANVARDSLGTAQLEEHWTILADCEIYGEYAREMIQAARDGKRTLFEDVVDFIQSVGKRHPDHSVILTLQD